MHALFLTFCGILYIILNDIVLKHYDNGGLMGWGWGWGEFANVFVNEIFNDRVFV